MSDFARTETRGSGCALVAIDPSNGDIKALIGGYDFEESKFNRATQAMRQTGSVFKPFVYTAAVDRGLKPDDIVVDARTNFGGYCTGTTMTVNSRDPSPFARRWPSLEMFRPSRLWPALESKI